MKDASLNGCRGTCIVKTARTGSVGDGKILSIHGEVIRIRTGECRGGRDLGSAPEILSRLPVGAMPRPG